MAVGHGKFLIRHDVGMRVANSGRDFARDEKIQRLIGERANGRIDQRGVDVTPSAGLISLHQCGENADY
jgi:hypothetical protein